MTGSTTSDDNSGQHVDAAPSEQGSQTPLRPSGRVPDTTDPLSVVNSGLEATGHSSAMGELSSSITTQPGPSSASKGNQPHGESEPSEATKNLTTATNNLVITLQKLNDVLEKANRPKEPEKDDDIKAELAVKWLEEFLPTVITVTTFGASIVFSVIVTDSEPSNSSGDASNGNSATAVSKGGFVTKDKAKHFSALAWLFFVIALGLAGMAYVAVTVNRPMLVVGFKEEKVNDSADGYEEQKKELKDDHEKRLGRFGLEHRQGGGASGFFEGTDCSTWEVISSYVWMHILKLTLRMFVKFPFSETVQIFVLGAFVFLSLVVVAYNGPVGYAALAFTGVITLSVGISWLIHMFPLGVRFIRFSACGCGAFCLV